MGGPRRARQRHILTTFDGDNYGETDGTSAATPFVSGAAALLKAHYGEGWSAALVRAHLRQTAAPIDGANPGYEGLLGSGRLDAGAALTTAPQPDLVAQTLTVDGQNGSSPEPGASVDLHVTLRNDWAPVGALQATLSSNDPYVTVEQNSTSFAALDTYATAQSDTPLQITVDNNAPYGHDLALQLTLREDGDVVDTVPFTLPVASQTINVNGIISSNTTWHGDRVYHITGNTIIAEGVTLTVEDGARVEVDAERVLRVEGELLSTGTEEAPVVFTSAEDSPAVGDWVGLEVRFGGRVVLTYCQISYADTGIHFNSYFVDPGHVINRCTVHHNQTGISSDVGGIAISNSRLIHNERQGAVLSNLDTILQDSEIAFNGGGIAGAGEVVRNNIHHNQGTFETAGYSGVGIYNGQHVYSNTVVMNTVGIAARSDTDIQHNNIDRSLYYNFWFEGNQDTTLPNNWWGTTDLNAINDTIYDFGEDSNLGIVDIQPILTEPSPAAPPYFYDVAVDPGETVGLEEATLDLSFSGPMDQSIAPEVLLKLEQWIDENDVPGWSETYINDMAVTSDGTVWLATDEGAVRYDGNEGTMHLEDSYVQSIAVDTYGDVWASDGNHLWRFDGVSWHKYFDDDELWYLPQDIVADATGGIWFADCSIVVHFDGVNAKEYHLQDVIDNFEWCVNHLDVSTDGTLWLAAEKQVISFDGNQWTVHDPQLDEIGEEWWIQSIAAASADDVWVNADQYLLHLDGAEWTVHQPAGEWHNYSSNIEIAANGDILVANNRSLYRYDGTDWSKVKSLPTTTDPFHHNNIYHIVDTSTGSLWLGTDNGIVQLYETPIDGGQWLDENTFQVAHQVTSLMPRGDYDVEVSGAFDADGNETPPVSHPAFAVDYAGEVADTTPPHPPSLTVRGVNGDASAVTANWQASDSDSAVTGYRYAIGSTSGGREIVNWTDTTATEITRTGFGFVEGETYWFSVQAQNAGGLWSETTTRSFIAGQASYDTYLPSIRSP